SGWPPAARPTGRGRAFLRAGVGAPDGCDVKPLVFEEPIQDAPGEGAVGAATLQGEFNRFFRLPLHPTPPDPRSSAPPRARIAACEAIGGVPTTLFSFRLRLYGRSPPPCPGSAPAGTIATNARPVNATKQIFNDRRRACVLMRTASAT